MKSNHSLVNPLPIQVPAGIGVAEHKLRCILFHDSSSYIANKHFYFKRIEIEYKTKRPCEGFFFFLKANGHAGRLSYTVIL